MELSIMVTCYNCVDSIDAAIDSVIKQEKPFSWELLIGDDGSTDGTVEKITKWCERYPENIHLYSMDRNGKDEKSGLRAARNRANLLVNASGRYLAFLDGDDQLLGTDKFVKQLHILENDKKNIISCVAHNILAIESLSGKHYNMVEDNLDSGIVDTTKYWNDMYFHTNTIVFRSDCKAMMLDKRYRDYLNDNFITFLILQYGSMYYINNVYAQYNITGSGLWTGKRRVYGCFRNVMLYDLERQINPNMRHSSFKRHLYDLLYISRNYDTNEDKNVFELLDGVMESDFPITFTLAKAGKLSLRKKIYRFYLTFGSEIYNFFEHLIHIKKYIMKKRAIK